MGRLTLLLLQFIPIFLLAQDYTGTWTGNFTRDSKTATMKLELVDDGKEVVGLFTIYSTDKAIPDKLYSVIMVERAGNKFVLRKYRSLTPSDKYENKLSAHTYHKGENISQATDAKVATAYSMSIAGKPMPNLSYASTVNFHQFIASFNSHQTIETLEGNWYVTSEGLKSYARPAGGFSVEKKQATISEEAKLRINKIFNR